MFRVTPYERKAFDLFNEFEREFFNLGKTEQTVCKTDIRDDGTSFVLEMEMPGFDKENIHIDIKGEYLTVSAKKVTETNETEGKYIRRERYSGEFTRSFDISTVDTDNIGAEYKNGILSLTLPKKGKTTPETRRLEIA